MENGCAEDFSTTNLQLLYGSNFHDRFLGNSTTDGRMTTLTLEHFDIYGTDNRDAELIAQPQLLLDLGRLFDDPHHLYLGSEWYLVRNNQLHGSVFQAMVKWVW